MHFEDPEGSEQWRELYKLGKGEYKIDHNSGSNQGKVRWLTYSQKLYCYLYLLNQFLLSEGLVGARTVLILEIQGMRLIRAFSSRKFCLSRGSGNKVKDKYMNK